MDTIVGIMIAVVLVMAVLPFFLLRGQFGKKKVRKAGASGSDAAVVGAAPHVNPKHDASDSGDSGSDSGGGGGGGE